MMLILKIIIYFLLNALQVTSVCVDDGTFVDELGNSCADWSGLDCTTDLALTAEGRRAVFDACGATCDSCVLANDYCGHGMGGDTVTTDTTDIDQWELLNHPMLVDGFCQWSATEETDLTQFSNAWGNPGDNTLMGCMAFPADGREYTDFVVSVDLVHDDNDGSGFIFGFKDIDDHYQFQIINDKWPSPPADHIPGPHMKLKKHNGGEVLENMDETNTCFDWLAYVANPSGGVQGIEDYPDGKLSSLNYIPDFYAQTYSEFDRSDGNKMTLTLIVKNFEARMFFKAADGQIVSTWARLPDTYAGGRIGLFTYAHQASHSNFRITDLSDGASSLSALCEDEGAECDTKLGYCINDNIAPTFHPTHTPTKAPTTGPFDGSIPAANICPGAYGPTTFMPDMTTLNGFDIVDHPKLTDTCEWIVEPDGLYQTTNAWGNPGDNTLMGCNILVSDRTYVDFIAEVEISHEDNDGVGFAFGWNAIDDHYLAIAINDKWPSPAADGIGGPFLKVKRHNGGEIFDVMDETNNAFDLITYIDSNGVSSEMNSGIPWEYEQKYPYDGTDFEPMKMTLIVKDNQLRVMFPSPEIDSGYTDSEPNNKRQSNRYTAAWTMDLGAEYRGGQIGLFTYAHQATFNDMKITDLSSEPEGYCEGLGDDVYCDGRVGLCLGVPIADVCPDPVNPNYKDTQSLDTFDLLEDPNLSEPCVWEIAVDGHIRQTSNAWGNYPGDNTLTGCNAVLKESYTDFIAQVRIDHRDNDGVGLVFGWNSVDDHFKAQKINDRWPSPAADNVGGPHLKIKRRNSFDCAEGAQDATNVCFDTISYVDQFGAYHYGMPTGAIAPSDYAKVYESYSEFDYTTLTLIVRDSKARLLYTAPSGRTVGAFAFALPNYSGGRVGLFTYAHQAQFSEFSVTPLDEVREFCNGRADCLPTGLCGTPHPTTSPTPASLNTGGSSKKKSSSNSATIIIVVVVCCVVAILVGICGVYFGMNKKKKAMTKAFEAVEGESKDNDSVSGPLKNIEIVQGKGTTV